MGSNKRFIAGFFLIALLTVLFLKSCDESFEPLVENDRYFFSMYGYLDASADTNWIRIIPLREGIDQLPDVVSVVTLEHLETGETSVMNDSLFTYAGGRQALNYWTTMELFPGQTYRLKAEREDGQSSVVLIEMPEDFPTPVVFEDQNTEHGLDTVLVEGVANLADVRTIWKVDENFSLRTPVYNFAHLQDTVEVIGTNWVVEMQTDNDFSSLERLYQSSQYSIDELITVTDKQVWVASAGPDWLFFPDIDENIIALPDGVSNVDNGVGYVIGIVSKTVPLRSCFDGDDIVACPEEQPVW